MSATPYAAQDYLAALQALLPRGRVWPREAEAVQTQVLAGLTQIYAATDERALDLLTETFPPTTYELLPDWEQTLGLTDSSATLQARRNQVVAKLVGHGGISVPALISYAANLGYSIQIRQNAPFRAGQSRAGQPVGGVEWFFVWTVVTPATTVSYFRAGNSAAGDPLSTWGDSALEAAMTAVSPAFDYVMFSQE